jgi:hypothetical protein
MSYDREACQVRTDREQQAYLVSAVACVFCNVHKALISITITMSPPFCLFYGHSATALVQAPYTIYSVFSATIFTFKSPPHDMFQPQMAINRCFVYAKTVSSAYSFHLFTHLQM